MNDCKVKVSRSGDVIYAVNSNDTEEDYSVKTLDSSDYSIIGTVDLKYSIQDFSINKNDTQLAFVQTSFEDNAKTVQLYDFGFR